MFRYFLIVFFLFSSIFFSSFSLSVETKPSINQLAANQQLHLHPQWLTLIHINKGGTIRDKGNSYVDDEKFFLSSEGKVSPEKELQATIDALFVTKSLDAQCRFVARSKWLSRELQLDYLVPEECEEYHDYRKQLIPESLSLIFPASYLNGPSSMFGHVLLRVDPPKEEGSPVWLSWAINYGARTEGSENSILYVYRGLAGGYPGRFVTIPYFEKIKEYSHLENRDIWEYSLDLTPKEVELIVDHLWELRGINFDYFFLDENCSYRLMALLEIARPSLQLTKRLRFAEPPTDTIESIIEAGLVTGRTYRPSKGQQLRNEIAELTASERKLALSLATKNDAKYMDAYQTLAVERRFPVVHAAYQYLRYQQRKVQRTKGMAKRSLRLLNMINALGVSEAHVAKAPAGPEEGHSTQRLGVTRGKMAGDDYTDVNYRIAYHDLLDNNIGFLKGAQIESLDFHVRNEDGEVKFNEFDVFNVKSITPRNEFFKVLSWNVQLGGERNDVIGDNSFSTFMHGGPGFAWEFLNASWGGHWLPYVFLDFRVEHQPAFENNIVGASGFNFGSLLHTEKGISQIDYQGRYYNNDIYQQVLSLQHQKPISKQKGVRLTGERIWQRGDIDHHVKASFYHYF